MQPRGRNNSCCVEYAGVVEEPARTGMLLALMDGRALTANERNALSALHSAADEGCFRSKAVRCYDRTRLTLA
jgi:hypothetical protein